MNKLFLMFISIILLFTNCTRYTEDKSTIPEAIQEKIKKFKRNACVKAEVNRCTINNKVVFVFDNGCATADNESQVYDEKGNDFCTIGGISGNLICDGIRVDTGLKNSVVIWKR